jgi:2-polyprenyl-3-methyl-5-hydroxy-6-metoxy-1,4-benzoquinol methylase
MQGSLADWWRTWFGRGYLDLYDEVLSARTPREIDAIETLLQLRPPLRILDLPCGQGRHSIELARRGYDVTGVDLSPYLLGVARERAIASGVHLRWRSGDMREPIAGQTFDLVLNLFTSFGYFEEEADDWSVIRSAAAMLEPAGRFVLEVINGERIMARFEEREWFTVGQAAVLDQRTLDRSARRMVVERTVSTPGETQVNVHAVRLYTGSELVGALRASGFDRVELYGDWTGEPLTPDSLRLIAVASPGAAPA